MKPLYASFIAEQSQVEIVPKVKMEKLDLIEGTFGPFRPPRKISVPLWVAKEMYSKGLCDIIAPTWLNPSTLTVMLEHEKEQETFSEMPFYHEELSKAILDTTVDSRTLSDVQQLRSLLYDLHTNRLKKLRDGVSRQANKDVIMVQNIGAMEINYIRNVLVSAMLELNKLDKN